MPSPHLIPIWLDWWSISMISFSNVVDNKLVLNFRQADSRWEFNFAKAHAATLNFNLFGKGYDT